MQSKQQAGAGGEVGQPIPVLRHRGWVRYPLRRQHRQRGATLVESAFWLIFAALIVYFAITFGRSLYDRVRAYQLTNELQAFQGGILSATLNEPNFAAVTTASLINNSAFKSAGKRASSTDGTVTGIFGGSVTVAPTTVNESNDAVAITYPSVPNGVCAVAVQSLTESFQVIAVNGTAVYEQNKPYSSETSGKACEGGASKNKLTLTMSRLG